MQKKVRKREKISRKKLMKEKGRRSGEKRPRRRRSAEVVGEENERKTTQKKIGTQHDYRCTGQTGAHNLSQFKFTPKRFARKRARRTQQQRPLLFYTLLRAAVGRRNA